MDRPAARSVVRVLVEAPVRPSEVGERVLEACLHFFPNGQARQDADRVTVEADDLTALRKRIWELRIIDTVRGALLHGLAADGRSLRFRIAKQAAYAGRLALPPAPHVLGDIEIAVEVEEGDAFRDAEALAWWLCPETEAGEIVGPTELPER